MQTIDRHSHINRPSPGKRWVLWRRCLDCGRRSPFAGISYEWYGPKQTCMRCGRTWRDGEWMPLDFVPQSRAKSIEAARKWWKKASDRGPQTEEGDEG